MASSILPAVVDCIVILVSKYGKTTMDRDSDKYITITHWKHYNHYMGFIIQVKGIINPCL